MVFVEETTVVTSVYCVTIGLRRLITKCKSLFDQSALCEKTTEIVARLSAEAI